MTRANGGSTTVADSIVTAMDSIAEPYLDEIRRLTRRADAADQHASDWRHIAFIIAMRVGTDAPADVEMSLRDNADRTDGRDRDCYLRAADMVRRACGQRIEHAYERAERQRRILAETRARQSAGGES